MCDQTREVVAVRALVARRVITFVSVYLRPEARGSHGADWVPEIAMRANTKNLVIGEDFNSKHTIWGYPLDSRRGKAVVEAMANTR